MYIIAGDIGGTKTHLSLFREEEKRGDFVNLQTFQSRHYSNFTALLKDYLEMCTTFGRVENACFAIAGPVKENRCRATNLPWVVDAKNISLDSGIPQVYLINDLEANAYSLDILSEENIFSLFPGKGSKIGNRVVISPGTGLGEAGLFWNGKQHRPFSCEGGHCDFGPRIPIEFELTQFLYQQFGHVSYERVLSGPGLYNIFDFFVQMKGRTPPSWLIEEMKEKDPSAVISENGLNGRSDLCVDALDLFVSIFASEAGNCALKFMAYGGVFLGGGIPPKILPKLEEPLFIENFINKGRLSSLLEEIPISVILDDKASLRGAAHFCRIQNTLTPY
jgi:glucokinase